VKQHVDGIVDYLNSENPLLPNAIVLALSSSVQFKKSRGPNVDDGVVAAGTLEIPVPTNGDSKPGWIVDGQQRSLALRKATNRNFPIPVAGFIADTVDVQRDQFVRVNNSKPLPTGLVTELLPEISTPISPRLAQRKLPSALVDLLNQADDSPFKGLIRRPSMSAVERKAAVVTDTSLVKGIEESLKAPSSCLFPYRNIASGETDIDGIWAVLVCYWTAVSEVFPDAWGLSTSKSRLMHGVGIRSMSRLMDRVMSNVNPTKDDASKAVLADLQRLAPNCRWTSGYWEDMGGAAWNSLQNTPKDIKNLSNHLIRMHFQAGNH
jgi:DGQHR domain-containing protein